MKKVQCINNHFFDGDKYDKCPHCGSAENPISNFTESRKGLFSNKADRITNAVKSITKTHGIFEHAKKHSESDENSSLCTDGNPKVQNENNSVKFDYSENNISNIYDSPQVIKTSEKAAASPLADTIRQISADTSGKTVGYFAGMGSTRSEPVVGWLVFVKGKNIGESYCLRAGRNTIGRAVTNDVALQNEMTVSREKHAIIIFEPKKSEFFIQPGEGRNLPYVNNNMIASITKLERFDKVELGECLCLFVPLCSDDFSWDEYIVKEN